MKRAAADDEPVYLELADALELYAAIIGGTVSEAGDQLRNRSGLESALARFTGDLSLAALVRSRVCLLYTSDAADE